MPHKKVATDSQDPLLESPFEMQNFNLTGLLKEWTEDSKLQHEKSIIIVGKSGIGKTEFAKVFCIKKNWKTLVVNHTQDFQRINTSYQAIIIDDANFSELSVTQKLAVINNTVYKTFRVLYRTVTRKMGVVTMILMNHSQHKEIFHLFKQKAFARRVIMVEPTQPFMINVNINVQNNYHSHHGDVIHNNTFQEHLKKEERLIQQTRQANL